MLRYGNLKLKNMGECWGPWGVGGPVAGGRRGTKPGDDASAGGGGKARTVRGRRYLPLEAVGGQETRSGTARTAGTEAGGRSKKCRCEVQVRGTGAGKCRCKCNRQPPTGRNDEAEDLGSASPVSYPLLPSSAGPPRLPKPFLASPDKKNTTERE